VVERAPVARAPGVCEEQVHGREEDLKLDLQVRREAHEKVEHEAQAEGEHLREEASEHARGLSG
jgi:hypothetical protein